MHKILNSLFLVGFIFFSYCAYCSNSVFNFNSEPFSDNKCIGAPNVVWDSQVGRAVSGSIYVPLSEENISINQSEGMPVNFGNFVEAECWAKTVDAGNTYFVLSLMQDSQLIDTAYGGVSIGSLTWRPNPIYGTNDWTKLRARSAVPKGVDNIRISLMCVSSKGKVLFDDISIRIVPQDEILGKLDKQKTLVDPYSLMPKHYVQNKNGHLWYKGRWLKIWEA